MAQPNVISIYTPAQGTLTLTPAGKQLGQARVGMTVAGVLLAGGAVFALGQFVKPDGAVRESFAAAPAGPSPAAAFMKPAVAAPSKLEDWPAAEVALQPLPPVVRDVAPKVTETPRASREPSATARRENARPPRRVPLAAEVQRAPASGTGLEDNDASSLQEQGRTAGRRRDLEGFLSDQGLILAVENQNSAAADRGIDPVAVRTTATPAGEALPEPAPGAAAMVAVDALPQAEPGLAPAVSEPVAEGETAAAPLVRGIAGPAPAAGTAPAPLIETLTGPVPPPRRRVTASLAEAVPQAVPLPPVSTAAIDAGPAEDLRSQAKSVAHREEARAVLAGVPRSALAAAPAPASLAGAAASAAEYVQLFPVAIVKGEALGAVALRDLGAKGQAIHLGSLVGLLQLRMPEAEYTRLATAAAADSFVTLDQLRAAGITVQYDARQDRLLIEAR